MMLIQALAFLISAIASPLGAYIGAKLYSDSKEKLSGLYHFIIHFFLC